MSSKKLKKKLSYIKIFFIRLGVLNCMIQLNAHSQVSTIITGSVQSTTKFKVFIYEPIESYCNIFEYDPNRDNSRASATLKNDFYKKIILSQPTFVLIRFATEHNSPYKRADILLMPGDSVHIECNPFVDDSSWLQFSGSNKDGNNLFAKKEFSLGDKYKPFFDIMDGLPTNKRTLVKDVDKLILVTTSEFYQLLEERKISIDYFNSIKKYYTVAYYERIISMLPKLYEKSNLISKIDKIKIIDTVLKHLPPLNRNLNGVRLGFGYKRSYYEYLIFRNSKIRSTEEIYLKNIKFQINSKKITIDKDYTLFTTIKNRKESEDIFAYDLLLCFLYSPGDCGLEQIKQFDQIFPNSKWSHILRFQEGIFNFENLAEYKLQIPITYIDSGRNYKGIEDLVKQNSTHPIVFVDIWASWCKPCINVFAANYIVDSFFISNNIQRVYVSLDHKKQPWLAAIEKYKLGGTHFFADSNFVTAIKRPFGILANESLSIPRYLIMSGDGKILDYDPPPPDNASFFSYLKKFIN